MLALSAAKLLRRGGWVVGYGRRIPRGFSYRISNPLYQKTPSEEESDVEAQEARSRNQGVVAQEIVFDEHGKIRIDSTTAQILDHPDPFKLSTVTSLEILFGLYFNCKSGYNINEKVHFLRRAEQLQANLPGKIEENSLFKRFIVDLKRDLTSTSQTIQPFATKNFGSEGTSSDDLEAWLAAEHRRLERKRVMPRVGSLALCLRKLQFEDMEVWGLLESHIKNYQFHSDIYEIINAMEGFQSYLDQLESNHYRLEAKKSERKVAAMSSLGATFILPPRAGGASRALAGPQSPTGLALADASNSLPVNPEDPEARAALREELNKRCRQIFRLLESEMIFTLSETHLNHPRRISDFLVATNSPNDISYATIEHYAKRAVQMPFNLNLDDAFKIFLNFAAAGKGSPELFEQMEHTLLQERGTSRLHQLSANYFDSPEKLDALFGALYQISFFLPEYRLYTDTQIKIKETISSAHLSWSIGQISRVFDRVHFLGVSQDEIGELKKQLVSHALKLRLEESMDQHLREALLERAGDQVPLLQSTSQKSISD